LEKSDDNNDGVAKSPPYGVTAVFQDLDILMYAFTPEKSPSLVGRNFCLAISRFFVIFYECINGKNSARYFASKPGKDFL